MTDDLIERRSRWTDHDVEQFVAKLLRTGVICSAIVTALGGALLLARSGMTHVDYHVFNGEPTPLRSVGGIVAGAARGDGRAWVQLGVLLLIATPIVRVALSLVAFVRQRDRLYVGMTGFVLAILLFSLILSGRP